MTNFAFTPPDPVYCRCACHLAEPPYHPMLGEVWLIGGPERINGVIPWVNQVLISHDRDSPKWMKARQQCPQLCKFFGEAVNDCAEEIQLVELLAESVKFAWEGGPDAASWLPED